MITIECKNLVKKFKLTKKQIKDNNNGLKFKYAVNDVSFSVEKGSIFGLLGPNGAGKTTIQRMLSTLIEPNEGDIFVNGVNTKKDPEGIKRHISFITGEMQFDKDLTPDYLFLFFGRLYGYTDEQIKSKRDVIFDDLEISSYRHTKMDKLSTGMKQKVSIAISLVNDPEIIIYDEPTNGLDIIATNVVINYIKRLKKQGKTIILSTHIFEVVEELCDEVAILIDGKIVYENKMEVVQSKYKNLRELFFDLYEERV